MAVHEQHALPVHTELGALCRIGVLQKLHSFLQSENYFERSIITANFRGYDFMTAKMQALIPTFQAPWPAAAQSVLHSLQKSKMQGPLCPVCVTHGVNISNPILCTLIEWKTVYTVIEKQLQK
eukprot:1156255-Pelagomonas_calceolata.AAC.3